MPVQSLCAALPAAPMCASGGVSSRCSNSGDRIAAAAAAGGRCRSISAARGGARDAVTSGAVGRPSRHRGLSSVRGLRAACPKRWVVQVLNSEPGQEGLEEKSTQRSEENNGPPVLTIIAGLAVLGVVLWGLGSLASCIVGLLFKS